MCICDSVADLRYAGAGLRDAGEMFQERKKKRRPLEQNPDLNSVLEENSYSQLHYLSILDNLGCLVISQWPSIIKLWQKMVTVACMGGRGKQPLI